MWRATILTLFPEMFPGPLGLSLAGEGLARDCGAASLMTSGRTGSVGTGLSTTPPQAAGPAW